MVPPFFASLNALAPKLMRLTNGDVGGELGASPSPMALSSMEPDGELLLPKLVRLFRACAEKGFVCEVGEPPRPRVMDVRRRC